MGKLPALFWALICGALGYGFALSITASGTAQVIVALVLLATGYGVARRYDLWVTFMAWLVGFMAAGAAIGSIFGTIGTIVGVVVGVVVGFCTEGILLFVLELINEGFFEPARWFLTRVRQGVVSFLLGRPLRTGLFYAGLVYLIVAAAGGGTDDQLGAPVAGLIYGLAMARDRRHWIVSYTLVGAFIGLVLANFMDGGVGTKLVLSLVLAAATGCLGLSEAEKLKRGQQEYERRRAGDDLDGTYSLRHNEASPETGAAFVP